jgi:hypothetical protein
VTLTEAIAFLVGEYDRFGPMADRVEGLVEAQVGAFVPGHCNWMVLPWDPAGGVRGFYLFSEDREGQRRGREVLNGFLGPAVARIVTISDHRLATAFTPAWKEAGLVRASLIQRVSGFPPDDMLARLEDASATMAGRPALESAPDPSHVDLLRDFRLAIQVNDPVAAEHLLYQLTLTGELSAENLRFLTVELLACFGRWQEMAALPWIRLLTVARRPRSVTESLLQMIWWTSVVPGLGSRSVRKVLASLDLVADYGNLLRVIQVPATAPGRMLAFFIAITDADAERQQAILDTVDDAERAALLGLLDAALESPTQPESGQEPEPEPEFDRSAFELGNFLRVIDMFLAGPKVEHADMAVEAVLELNGHDRATEVEQLVQAWVKRGDLDPGRRLKRDLEELEQLVAGACAGWVDWAQRIGAAERWGDAATVLRNRRMDWVWLADLPAAQVALVADRIINALGSANEEQLRASLDLLCEVAAEVVGHPGCAEFCEVVLQLLSDQENVSAQVREAYVVLFAAILAAGPSRAAYLEILEQTGALWDRIKSRSNVDWALQILDTAVGETSPDRDRLNAFGAAVVMTVRKYPLLLRQGVDVEALAPEFGLAALPVDRGQSGEDGSVWARLDGKVVGLYSLLGHAIPRFTDRVRALCNSAQVRGNNDTTATAALTNLAERADHLVVDTWHAAHQATGAIDAVRSRDRQILPRQRGVSGFVRALEENLDA